MKLFLSFLLIAIPQLGVAATDASTAEQYVERYATQYRVPPELIAALIDVESRWNPHALSKCSSCQRRPDALEPFSPMTRSKTSRPARAMSPP